MTSTATHADDSVKQFLGPRIDAATREHFHESAKKAPFFIRLMAETLHADEAKMRTILLDLGPDGLEAANLALDFIAIRDKMMGVAEGMKAAAGRIVMTLEQMETDGDIETTDAILEPLKAFYDAMEKARPVAGVAAADLTTDTADATLLRLGDELDQARAREKALIDSKTSGDTSEAALNVTSRVIDQIEKQQAHTLEGFRVKARAVMWCHQGAEGHVVSFSLSDQRTTDIRLAESIVFDLAGVAS